MNDISNYGWTLSRPAFFTKFQSRHPEHSTRDLIAVNNDICYLWRSEKRTITRAKCSEVWGGGGSGEGLNSSKTGVLTLPEATSGTGDDSQQYQYKEYQVSPEITFEPTRLEARYSPSSGELLLFWCQSGMAVVKLSTTGAVVRPNQNQEQQQKSSFLSASCIVPDEREYLEHHGLRIIHAKWFPTPGHDIIAALNNDNFLRFYLLNQPNRPIALICVGPRTSAPHQYTTYSVGLIETPIDFDFGPELSSSSHFLLFVLKNSGEISYVLIKYLANTFQCDWYDQKELALDNEEIEDRFQDAAAIMATNTFPVILTIGCTSGKLHHVVLFPVDDEGVSEGGNGDHERPISTKKLNVSMEESMFSGDVTLFIKEVVEIEPEDDELGLSFMKFIPDPLCKHRYAVVHGEGVHIININFLPAIEAFIKGTGGKGKSSPSPQTQLLIFDSTDSNTVSTNASVRFVLRCKLFQQNVTTDSDQRQRLPTYRSSFTFSDSIPQKFILMLGEDGTAVYDIPHLLDIDLAIGTASETDGQQRGETSTITSQQQLNTVETLKSILHKTTNQPLLLRQGGGESDQENVEQLLSESLRTLHREYILKQEQALTHLAEALKTISIDTKEFGDHMTNSMIQELAEIKSNASRLTEEYAAVSAKETELQNRINALTTAHHDVLPLLTDEEKRWLLVLDKMESEVESMKELVDGLRISVTSPVLTQAQDRMQEIISQTCFTDTQLNNIRLAIGRQQQALANLKNSVNTIRKKLPNANE